MQEITSQHINDHLDPFDGMERLEKLLNAEENENGFYAIPHDTICDKDDVENVVDMLIESPYNKVYKMYTPFCTLYICADTRLQALRRTQETLGI